MYSVNVRLPAALQAFVESQIQSGKFETAAEVVRDALRQAQERATEYEIAMTALKHEIGLGLKDFEEGKYTRYKNGEELIAAARARVDEKKKKRPG